MKFEAYWFFSTRDWRQVSFRKWLGILWRGRCHVRVTWCMPSMSVIMINLATVTIIALMGILLILETAKCITT